MNFPSLSETIHLKGKTKKVATVWKRDVADLIKGEPAPLQKAEQSWRTLFGSAPAHSKQPMMWWEFQDRKSMFEENCSISRNYEPAAGPMDMATDGARLWNAIDDRWQRMKPSAALARSSGPEYWKHRDAELRRRGGEALVEEWHNGISWL